MLSMRSQAYCLVLLLAGLSGCSSSAEVSGKVTVRGKEVVGGDIVFSPLDDDGKASLGKPGMAGLGEDGSYSLKLESGPSGLAKRFAVRFTPAPLPPMPEAEARVAVSPYLGMIPKEGEVEVKPGINVINVELIRATKK